MELPEDRLCDYVAGLERRQFSDPTRQRLGQAVLDWFTAGWSGAAMGRSQDLRAFGEEILQGDGCAPVFGGSTGTNPIGSAFCNAGIAHLREIDDAHRTAMLHPGIVAISPVMAVAATRAMTVQQFSAAVVAGYEVAIRCGEALGGQHSGLFHATATAGAVGAAAATAVALGLDRASLHHALGIAATQATGLWQFVDDKAHDSKALHPAFAVRNGMMAAYAARRGFGGARAFMSGKRGMHALLQANGPLGALDARLGEEDRINSSTIKAWPTCAQLFTVIGATTSILEDFAPDPSLIESIDIAIYPQALKIAGVDWPQQAAEAGFCARYCVAVLLLTGRLGIKETESPDLNDVGLRALASRITVRAEPQYGAAFPQRRPATVSIQMKDGREFTAMRELRRGDPEDPFDWPALNTRLQAFCPTLDAATGRALAQWCEALSQVELSTAFVKAPKNFFAISGS